MGKERYIVEVYDSRADMQVEGIPMGMDFYFDDFDKASQFAADMVLTHKKHVIFGISKDEA